ncbi:MAG TPA: MFS transporter [Solirubrobacteraceae bacterium]|nr:MFS transporter [Solirubrobacteraceae bacterium]
MRASAQRASEPRIALVAATTAFTLVILGTTVVNVALPSIRAEFGSSVAGLQWVINGYTLMLASLLLSMGAMCDKRGARPVMLGGVTVFVLGALVSLAAPSLAVLLTGQVLLGTGAAALLPASLALLSDAYPDDRRRARAIAIFASASAVAIGLGPVLGGLLIDSLGWRAIFGLDVPLAVIIGLLVAAHRPRAAPTLAKGLDGFGQVTAILSLGALTFAVIQSGSSGWLAAPVLGPLAVAVGAAFAFVAIERAGREPMLPLSIFASRAFNCSSVSGLLINFGVYGQFFVLSLYLQELRGLSPLQVGVVFLVQPGTAALTSLAAGAITVRRGPRIPAVTGGALATAGTLAIAGIDAHTPLAQIVGGLALLGAGGGLTIPALTTAIVSASARRRVGVAAATFTASRQIGGILGVAVLGALVGQPVGLPGLHTAVLVAAGVLAAAALLGLLVAPDGPGAEADTMTVIEAVAASEG